MSNIVEFPYRQVSKEASHRILSDFILEAIAADSPVVIEGDNGAQLWNGSRLQNFPSIETALQAAREQGMGSVIVDFRLP